MAMEGLGRLFNAVPTADAVEVNFRDAAGITFFCIGADTYTIRESTSAAGAGVQDLLAWDHWYTNSGAVGATAWVEASDSTPAAAAVIAANAALFVPATRLSAGFDFIQCNSAAGGLVFALVHDLYVQRNPANLPALGV